MNTRIPNFCIVGAPRCGTTAIYAYLQSHPYIFLPEVKEPHFFATDYSPLRTVRSFQEYSELFEPCKPCHLAVGEASVFYLFSQVAINNLLEFKPDMKLIVMLRNPVDMVYSLHSQYLYWFREDEADFRVAWSLQEKRSRGDCIPKTCPIPNHLQYGQIGMLGKQVEMLLEKARPEQVKLVLFDDMVNSPRQIYLELLAFLGVPDDGRNSFRRVNENKHHRYRALSWFLMCPPYPFNRLKKMAKIFLNLKDGRAGCGIYTFISTRSRRNPLPGEFREELVDYFSEDVTKLGQILGRDLTHWAA